MELALIPITPTEAFAIMTACREKLDGRACEHENEDKTARLWVFSTPISKSVIVAWITGKFFVRTHVNNKKVRHAA
jgi:hypothetical protein